MTSSQRVVLHMRHNRLDIYGLPALQCSLLSPKGLAARLPKFEGDRVESQQRSSSIQGICPAYVTDPTQTAGCATRLSKSLAIRLG